MLVILTRLFIIYFITVFSFRVMGKRQVGELQLSELVCAIFISELATLPVGNKSTPLIYGIIPIVFLLSSEVLISFLSTKVPFIKRIFDSAPDIIIDKGELKPKALSKTRMTVEELLSELRLQGAPNIENVYYAILEANGRLSIVLKADAQPLSPNDCKIKADECGIDHALIIDGKINTSALDAVQRDEKWLLKEIKKNGYQKPEDIFLFILDDGGNIFITRRNT